jgi:hypothetical protein
MIEQVCASMAENDCRDWIERAVSDVDSMWDHVQHGGTPLEADALVTFDDDICDLSSLTAFLKVVHAACESTTRALSAALALLDEREENHNERTK